MRSVLCLLLLAGLPAAARAQAAAPDPAEGHLLFSQNCAVCHLLPQITSKLRYGPPLDRSLVAGQAPALRDFIAKGSAHMPGFRYDLTPGQIDAILAYLATVPAPAQPAAPGGSTP